METERRRYPRITCNGTATLDLGTEEPCPAYLLDLSVEGCHLMFDSPQSIPRGAEMLMTFEVDKMPFDVRAQAKSVRSDTSVGVYFPELTENVRTDLQGLIDRLAQSTPQPAANRLPWEPGPAIH